MNREPHAAVDIRRRARRIVSVHLSDRSDPARGWCDRVLPGDGVIPLSEIFTALEAGSSDPRETVEPRINTDGHGFLSRRHWTTVGQRVEWRLKKNIRVYPCASVVSFNGWYDLEILSDNGLLGNDYADSVWKLPLEQIVHQGRTGFLRAWAARKAN